MTAEAMTAAGDSASERMEDLLHVDPLELEIGFRLIGLADPTRGGDLLGRLKAVRQRVARELGLIAPQVHIHDEIGLPPNEYRVKIRGTIVGQGITYAGRLLAVPPAGLVTRPDGRDGVDPITGQPAVWIHADGREVAELAGCRVYEATAVVANHFGEIVANHADELLTREQVERLLDRVRRTAPTLVGEVVPGLLRPANCSASCKTCSANVSAFAIWNRSWRRWPCTPARPRTSISGPSRCASAWRGRLPRRTNGPTDGFALSPSPDRSTCDWRRPARRKRGPPRRWVRIRRGASFAPSPLPSARWSRAVFLRSLSRPPGACGSQRLDPGRLAPAGGLEPAGNPPRYAGRDPWQRCRGRARGREYIRHHGGLCLNGIVRVSRNHVDKRQS